MLNLHQITEQGVRVDLHDCVILKQGVNGVHCSSVINFVYPWCCACIGFIVKRIGQEDMLVLLCHQ